MFLQLYSFPGLITSLSLLKTIPLLLYHEDRHTLLSLPPKKHTVAAEKSEVYPHLRGVGKTKGRTFTKPRTRRLRICVFTTDIQKLPGNGLWELALPSTRPATLEVCPRSDISGGPVTSLDK